MLITKLGVRAMNAVHDVKTWMGNRKKRGIVEYVLIIVFALVLLGLLYMMNEPFRALMNRIIGQITNAGQ